MVNLAPVQVLDGIRSGELPGRVTKDEQGEDAILLRERDMLALPGAIPPLFAWKMCLRSGFDPAVCPNPAVAKAIAAVPPDLKDLSHGGLLEVARRVGEIMGRSDQHKKDLARLRKIMAARAEAMRVWAKVLDRMEKAGELPDWACCDAPGIREVRHPPEARPKHPGPKRRGSHLLNRGDSPTFTDLPKEQTLTPNPTAHTDIVASVRKNARRLRAHFERLGRKVTEQRASRRGQRIDLGRVRTAALTGTPNLLVHSRDEVLANAYVGVLIDRSGSMDGEKIELAKRFAILLAESAKGIRGIEGHVNAFDDDTFYLLGDLQHNAVASLEAGGGNNDAGGLAKAAELAQRSRKQKKLLIMISDGSPTECTFESLSELVERLTRQYGILCAQVAVESMEEIAFPQYVDLSRYSMDEAVARLGTFLMKLTAEWR